MIPGDPLFDWLVAYHIEHNLPKCLPYLREGRIIPPARRDPLREGRDENDLYSGVLVVANGSTLMNRLRKGHVINDAEDIEPVRLVTGSDLSQYLQEQDGNDGAYIYDSVNHQVRRVMEFNNSPPSLRNQSRTPLRDSVPRDFVSTEPGFVQTDQHFGTKTRLAIKLPQAYDHTTALQIKRTAYGPLGIGKVTQFGPQGLEQEFFFRYEPRSEGPFVNQEAGIVGVHRRYERNPEQGIILVSSQPYQR